MADLFLFLIYMGGIDAVPKDWGFWKTIGWPYQLGQFLVKQII